MLVNLLPVADIRPLPSAFCASRKSGRSCKPQRKRQRKRSGRGQKGAFVCDETPHYATQYTPGSISASVGRAQSRGRTRPHRALSPHRYAGRTFARADHDRFLSTILLVCGRVNFSPVLRHIDKQEPQGFGFVQSAAEHTDMALTVVSPFARIIGGATSTSIHSPVACETCSPASRTDRRYGNYASISASR